jgi:phosphomannomutase
MVIDLAVSRFSFIINCIPGRTIVLGAFLNSAQSMSNQTRQLFGTDGIRGVAGEFPLTGESTYLIGRALGHDLIRSAPKARAVMGQDTRESSGWIADRVAAGMAAVGVDVHSAGVITTPGVAYLARSRGFAAGVVISASHNPWTDNGIKVFSGDGFKLTDARELAIEKEIFALLQAGSGRRYRTEDCPAIPAGRGGAAQGVHRVTGGQRSV